MSPWNLHFFVEGPPVAQGRPRAFRRGAHIGVYQPKHCQAWQSTVKACAVRAMGGQKPFPGPVALVMRFSLPIPDSWATWKKNAAAFGQVVPTGSPDLDNLAKAVMDGLNSTAWLDDCQVVEMTVSKHYTDQPGVWVCLRALSDTLSSNAKRTDLFSMMEANP